MTIAARKAALMQRVRDFGGPLNEPAVLAQFLAQVMHESGNLRHVREIWGKKPTKAQAEYEGRKDLGNTQPGDGKRFMGRDVLQITGRANYRALTKWVRETFGAKVDFEANPELLESEEWLGIGAIWYFLTRKDLLRYCREGNIEMVTKRVNGGLNGYADRLKWYDASALKLLGFETVREFQKSAGLVVDGISGPKTRAALHGALGRVKAAPSPTVTLEPAFPLPETPVVNTTPVVSREPADSNHNAPAGSAKMLVALLALLGGAAFAFWNWLLGLFTDAATAVGNLFN